MKKLIPILAALVISGLLISVLFVSDVLQIKDDQGNKIDVSKLISSATTKPESLTFIQHMDKGNESAKKGLTSLAFNEYLAANKLDPSSAAPYLKIGQLLFANKDYPRAQQIFQQMLQKDPASLDGNIYLARTYIMQRNPEKAKEVLEAIQTVSQQKSYYRGLLAAYFGDYESAKKLLGDAITNNTDPALGNRSQKILTAFSEYNLNQGSQEIFLKTLLAKSFNQVNEYTLSIPLLFNVVKEKKDYRDAWILLGYAYLNIDDDKNAIDALEEAKRLDQNKPETLFFLGLSYSANSQNEIAVHLIEDSINKGFEPKIQAQQKLAEIYLEMKDYAKSAAKYESVIALNNSDVDYFIRPMWIYIDQLHQPALALTLAQKAIVAHPTSGMAQNLVGWAYLANNDLVNARTYLTKALELDPNLSAAYLNLGKLYEQQVALDTAKEYYKTAYRLGEGTSIADAAADLYNKILASTGVSGSITSDGVTPPSTNNMPTIGTLDALGQSLQTNITAPSAPLGSSAPSTYAPPRTPNTSSTPTFTLPPLTTAP